MHRFWRLKLLVSKLFFISVYSDLDALSQSSRLIAMPSCEQVAGHEPLGPQPYFQKGTEWESKRCCCAWILPSIFWFSNNFSKFKVPIPQDRSWCRKWIRTESKSQSFQLMTFSTESAFNAVYWPVAKICLADTFWEVGIQPRDSLEADESLKSTARIGELTCTSMWPLWLSSSTEI